jgi:UDP:flavonoid glycosyltransferase YjiC (YdhE family)
MTTNPGIGHLAPMLPLARAMRDAGHDVAFAAAASFGPAVRRAGFPHVSCGLDWLESAPEQAFPEFASAPAHEDATRLLRDVFADAAAHHMARDLLEHCQRRRPDVLIRNDYEFGACVAAEVARLPQVTVSVTLLWTPEALAPVVGEQLAYLRSAFGLIPDGALSMLYPQLYLTYAPPRLQPPMLGVEQPFQASDGDLGAHGPVPAWLDELPARPLVYGSLGTVVNRVPGVFETIMSALADQPVNVVLTVGDGQAPGRFTGVPDNVRVAAFIPNDTVLRRADVFITPGSLFTVVNAVRRTVPLLLVPIAGDEPMHARRFAALGLGLVVRRPGLAATFLDARTPVLSPEAVRGAVRALLHEPRYRLGVAGLRDEIAALPGPAHVVRLVEAVAGR